MIGEAIFAAYCSTDRRHPLHWSFREKVAFLRSQQKIQIKRTCKQQETRLSNHMRPSWVLLALWHRFSDEKHEKKLKHRKIKNNRTLVSVLHCGLRSTNLAPFGCARDCQSNLDARQRRIRAFMYLSWKNKNARAPSRISKHPDQQCQERNRPTSSGFLRLFSIRFW